MFKKYPKIHRLGKEETDGILTGTVVVQEKIDGANTSIWLGEDNLLHCGTRTREITEGFNGFVDYVNAHQGIRNFFSRNPQYRLYGEWLVRHTIQYDETKMKKFYLFDVTEKVNETENCIECNDGQRMFDDGGKCSKCDGTGQLPKPERYLPQKQVAEIAMLYGMEYPQVFGEFSNPELDAIRTFVGQTNLGDKGEGVVLKNLEHRDKWGNHCHAKIVTEAFKEDNGITFGGNNKHSDTYWEMYITNKYMTLPRIQKIMNKVQPEIDERLDMKHIPRITSQAYHDMLTEEIWEISKKVGTIDFKVLKRVAVKKAVQIYKDILNDSISVADQT